MREDMATKSCPSESQISSKDVKELILFRKLLWNTKMFSQYD